MKKVVRIIASVLVCVLLVSSVGLLSAASIRGYIKNQDLPVGFSEAVKLTEAEKDSDAVRIMTSNLLVNYKSWGGSDARPRAKMFFGVLDEYAPDVVGLQEVSDQWYTCIMQNKGKYKMLYPVSTGLLMRMTALIYNSETLDLIDKGQLQYENGNDARLRRAVWGLFEHKETKKQFIVISTHFDTMRPGQEEEMFSFMESQKEELIALSAQLKEMYNVPVFSIGDFNSCNAGGNDPVMDAPEIYEALSKELTDVKDVAEEKLNGDALGVDEPTWDHIFLDGEADVQRYAILSHENFKSMSDHFPIFADVYLKGN